MGVPTLFKKIIDNKYYKNIHRGIKNGQTNADYFFMDYNGIVYNAYENIKKDIEKNDYTKDKIEELVLEEVVSCTKALICDVIKPKKLTYIALDGPAPRAKMVQQRSRRFKAVMEKKFMKDLNEKFKMNESKVIWDRSANISPGTEFMEKLSNRIIKAMKEKTFQQHNKDMKIIFNNGNTPGEGEHKFLNLLRNMRTMESKKNDKIYLYGRDADLIILAVCTHKSNIHIVREIKAENDPRLNEMYEGYTYLELNIDNLKDGFYNDIIRKDSYKEKEGIKIIKKSKVSLLNDYIFLTFLAGNDFVLSLPFLKIKKRSLEKIINIYQEIKDDFEDYLVKFDFRKDKKPSINIDFLKKIYEKSALKEDEWMKKDIQSEVDKFLNGYMDQRQKESESKLSEYDKIKNRYTHTHIASPHHPLFKDYQKEIRSLDYNKDYEIWRSDYYENFLNVKSEEDSKIIDLCIENYLESLYFTLNYYLVGCPSWSWHYKFRVAPLLNDVFSYLDKHNDAEKFNNFKLDGPMTPFQQLLFILPPQNSNILPEVLRPIMTDSSIGVTQYYPEEIRIDAAFGGKTMYSEAILPEIDDIKLKNIIEKYEKKLTGDEKNRNIIREKSFGN
jgi:5'-3' exonuclease|tara:strand:+ start:3393 stop:5231 length:1839 start_codon:yes stop_codon:yes gene_type:complete